MNKSTYNKGVPHFLFFIWCLILSSAAYSQVPQGIPYQAVARNGQGQPLANLPVKVRFSILDSTLTGPAVYSETHQPTTSALGLFSVNVGMGSPSQGTFAGINWGVNAKFLKVELDTTATGSNYIDLGTQQMMSVPYALQSMKSDEARDVRVRISGDTLFIGESDFVIIPGIETFNNTNGSVNGGILLPFNSVCYDQYIAVNGCGGQDSISYNGHTYPLVEINGQCWFKTNLMTTHYRHGTPITKIPINNWYNNTIPTYAFYNNDSTLGPTYGALYNYAIVESDSVCPVGWHISTDCDWMYLEKTIGFNSVEQQQFGQRYNEGTAKIVTTDSSYWQNSYYQTYGTNETEFSALGSGIYYVWGPTNNDSYFQGRDCLISLWSKNQVNKFVWRQITSQLISIFRFNNPKDYKFAGMSIRCLKN